MGGRRHPPGLKYMVTELVCHATGGPEVVTSKGFDEAKLGVAAEDWPVFLELAADAASLWSIPHLRNSIVSALSTIKAEICIGIVEEDSSAEAQARRLVQQAGFDHYLTSAALEHAEGDPSAALELLAKGWHPLNEIRLGSSGSATPMSTMSSTRSLVDADDGRGAGCPFGFDRLTQPAKVAKTAAIEPASSVDDKLAAAAIKMADQGMPLTQIAMRLGLDEELVQRTVAQANTGEGKLLGNKYQEQLDELLQEDPELCCPVSLVLFVNPVIASDGFMYEKASLEGLLRANMASPMTRERLKKDYLPAKQRRSAAIEFRERRAKELVRFVGDVVTDMPQMATTALDRITEYLDVLQNAGIASEAAAVWAKMGRPLPHSVSSKMNR